MTESVTNWLGQVIRVGTVVARGARDGNTSSFKVGKILKINDNGTARVHWLYEPSYYREREAGIPRHRLTQCGSPSVDTLFVVDPSTFDFDIGEWSE